MCASSYLFFQHFRRVWRFRTESPDVSFCSDTSPTSLLGLELANQLLCLRRFDGAELDFDLLVELHLGTSARTKYQQSTIKFEIKICYGYEDLKKKAIRDSQASTFSKLLTVDIVSIQQFVFSNSFKFKWTTNNVFITFFVHWFFTFSVFFHFGHFSFLQNSEKRQWPIFFSKFNYPVFTERTLTVLFFHFLCWILIWDQHMPETYKLIFFQTNW